jgi:hypothetical protein
VSAHLPLLRLAACFLSALLHLGPAGEPAAARSLEAAAPGDASAWLALGRQSLRLQAWLAQVGGVCPGLIRHPVNLTSLVSHVGGGWLGGVRTSTYPCPPRSAPSIQSSSLPLTQLCRCPALLPLLLQVRHRLWVRNGEGCSRVESLYWAPMWRDFGAAPDLVALQAAAAATPDPDGCAAVLNLQLRLASPSCAAFAAFAGCKRGVAGHPLRSGA